MEDQLITVAAFDTAPQMGLVKSKLESEGIECFVKDEYTSQAYINSVVGGMKIQVYPQDEKRAREIIEEMGVYSDPKNQSSRLMAFERATNRMPLLRNANVVIRLFAFLVLLAVVLAALYALLVI